MLDNRKFSINVQSSSNNILYFAYCCDFTPYTIFVYECKYVYMNTQTNWLVDFAVQLSEQY